MIKHLKGLSLALFYSLLLIAGFLVFSGSRASEFTAAIRSSIIVDLTNKDRTINNIGALRQNDRLARAASLKAEDMAKKSYFAETSPEGLTYHHWLTLAGYKYVYAGENLAINFNKSIDLEGAWMSKPRNRANILNARYTDIGIGMARGVYQGREVTYIVEMFGSTATSTLSSKKISMQGATAFNAFLSVLVLVNKSFREPEVQVP